eukprot:531443-Rhodomonas_salina.1
MYAYDVSTAVWTNLSLAAMPPPGAAHHARKPNLPIRTVWVFYGCAVKIFHHTTPRHHTSHQHVTRHITLHTHPTRQPSAAPDTALQHSDVFFVASGVCVSALSPGGPTTSSLGAHGQPPGARYGLGMAAVGSKLFVYGGRDGASDPLPSVLDRNISALDRVVSALDRVVCCWVVSGWCWKVWWCVLRCAAAGRHGVIWCERFGDSEAVVHTPPSGVCRELAGRLACVRHRSRRRPLRRGATRHVNSNDGDQKLEA